MDLIYFRFLVEIADMGERIDTCIIGLLSIIIIDRMTSVFNTGASLLYNHDLFESLIVKKRAKKLTTRSPLTSDGSHILCCLQPGELGSRGPHPGRRVAPTAPKRFVISFILLCQIKGWPPLLQPL
ncbi:hypothetical protein T265_10785 [Opisthorchis viverrini]|uniref:Uncharacterized protein n=1 Tax=Opisthorchis viverrini TaxID=6198 RepID=A0A074Z5D1_OPIVI|nr:hypothetical protein T265_10785 [Opisthorchis viverrini]KER20732.1 hypothetical protein T265_10785 [Opisthorchis viverrini]